MNIKTSEQLNVDNGNNLHFTLAALHYFLVQSSVILKQLLIATGISAGNNIWFNRSEII
jgi:hypothetical protein